MGSTVAGRMRVVPRGGLWVVIVLEALLMGAAGFSKFSNPDFWLSSFVEWGYPAGLASVIGGVEMIGGVLLLVPRLAAYSAGVLVVVMLVATGTVLLHPGTLGPGASLVNAAALVVVLVGRWGRRRGRPTVGG